MRRLALALLLLLVALACVLLWRPRPAPTVEQLPARSAIDSTNALSTSTVLSASGETRQSGGESRVRAEDSSGAVLEVALRDDLGRACPGIWLSITLPEDSGYGVDLDGQAAIQRFLQRPPQNGANFRVRDPKFVFGGPSANADWRATGEDGRASWSDVPAHLPLTLTVSTASNVRGLPAASDPPEWFTHSGPVTLEPGEHRSLELVLLRTGGLRGRVLDSARRPVAGARVQLHEEGAASRPAPFAPYSTDANGQFEIRGVRDGTGLLSAVFTTPERDPALVMARWEIAPGAERDLGDLVPGPRRIALRVRAFDADGVDVTDVAAHGAEARGGAAVLARAAPCWQLETNCRLGAAFALLGLPNENVRIELELADLRVADGFRLVDTPTLVAVELSAVDDVGLLRVPVVRARAVTWKAPPIRRAGVPDQNGVAELRVVLVPESGAPLAFEMRALLGLEFESVQNLPPGKYSVFAASTHGIDDACARQELLVADAGDQTVELRIHPGARLQGRLSEKGGTFELVPIDASGERELPWLQQGRADAVGHYVLNGVLPDVPLSVRPGGRKLVTPAGEHTLDIELPRAR